MPKPLRVQGSPFIYGIMTRDVFDPIAVWDELVFCHHVLKSIRIEVGKSPVVRDVDLLVAGELELGLAEGFQSHVPWSAAWCGWTL